MSDPTVDSPLRLAWLAWEKYHETPEAAEFDKLARMVDISEPVFGKSNLFHPHTQSALWEAFRAGYEADKESRRDAEITIDFYEFLDCRTDPPTHHYIDAAHLISPEIRAYLRYLERLQPKLEETKMTDEDLRAIALEHAVRRGLGDADSILAEAEKFLAFLSPRLGREAADPGPAPRTVILPGARAAIQKMAEEADLIRASYKKKRPARKRK